MGRLTKIYTKVLISLVHLMLAGAGVGVLVMIVTICADVILRRFGVPIIGSYDIVKIAGALTLAMALPYTTAVKGHVAIEYFFHKFSRRSRLYIDIVCRLLGFMLFVFLGIRCFFYGNQLFRTGQVTQTLQLPIFWVPYIIGVCSLTVSAVILYHIIHPNREMIKP